eukprot:scaffold51702_cov320-Isochrysis_galbana.AAC.1
MPITLQRCSPPAASALRLDWAGLFLFRVGHNLGARDCVAQPGADQNRLAVQHALGDAEGAAAHSAAPRRRTARK